MLVSPDSRANPALVFLFSRPKLRTSGNTVKKSDHFRLASKPSSTIASFAYGLFCRTYGLVRCAQGLVRCAQGLLRHAYRLLRHVYGLSFRRVRAFGIF